MYRILIMVIAGFASFILAFVLNNEKAGYAGYAYFLIGPAIGIFFTRRTRVRRKLFPGPYTKIKNQRYFILNHR
jgi:hypothetical protein